MLLKGNKAPDFELPDQDQKLVRLSQFQGQYVVLFFYPKDDTPTCTREAAGFSALKEQFLAKHTQILGLSKDSPRSHLAFCGKYGLQLRLLSDTEGTTLNDYGVWQKKLNFGISYMGIVRTTLLIDPEGKIMTVWEKVRGKGHPEAVLQAIP